MKKRKSSTFRGSAVVAHLRVLHAGRDPVRLAMKYRAMRRSFGDFVRGTCSLFYLRAGDVEMPPSPSIWVCGDVHLGNFGIYQAEDARLRFDLNDFDEAGIAPCLLDLFRLLAALRAASADPDDDRAMAKHAVAGYAAGLMKGADAAFDEAAGESILPKLLALAHTRDRGRWLNERTERAAGGRHFKLDGEKTLPSTPAERAALFSLAKRLGQEFGAPSFFDPIDAARRISGVGSLGLPRFLLGVAGKGKPDHVRLLDVKAARKLAFAVGLQLPCPPGLDDAERIIQAQRLILERPSAPIAAVDLLGDRFTICEVQPCAVRLEASLKYPRKLGRVLGKALARAHMRAARRTSATDAFDKFTHDATHWSGDVAATGILFADTLRDDWRSTYRLMTRAPSQFDQPNCGVCRKITY